MPLLDGARHALAPTVLTLVVAVLTAPISYWQYGRAGVGVVAAGAVTVIVSFALAGWLMKSLSHAGSATAGMLAATGFRMVLPLTLVLVIVIGDGQLVPVRTVIYLVPLYLSMLCAETVLSARRPGGTRGQADVGQG
jgi:hypothetical protein